MNIKTFGAVLMGVSLVGCSTTSQTFDCQAGKGVGCQSISQVNKMVDRGELANPKDDTSSSPVSPVIAPNSPSQAVPSQDVALSDDMVVHRIREEHLRVWIAPFQDQNGNLYEGTTIHTVLKPGFWHIQGGQ
jgi:conjugal transfer pilus assembly protein TraV